MSPRTAPFEHDERTSTLPSMARLADESVAVGSLSARTLPGHPAVEVQAAR